VRRVFDRCDNAEVDWSGTTYDRYSDN
jgi:hypothetical protein